MNPQEKSAWYSLAVIIMALVACGALYSATGRPVVAMAGFALLALLIFGGLFGVRSKSGLAGDERDQLIALKAHTVSLFIFWVYFVSFCFAALYFTGFSESIPTWMLIALWMGGLCVMKGTNAVTTLVLYHAN